MHAILNRPSRVLRIAAAIFLLVAFANAARADIFQWEYIDPAAPSQGKRQSSTLALDGAGVDAVPGANLRGRNLTMAYLIGANLTNASFASRSLITGAIWIESPSFTGYVAVYDFRDTRLTNADFTSADVRGASFSRGYCPYGYACQAQGGPGITLNQLYSTASYQAGDLSGIDLTANNLVGGNFAGQNLTNTNFTEAYLTDADFTDVDVRATYFGAPYYGTGITPAQLYSTASYKNSDLTGIVLSGNKLAGATFAGQNLTDANLYGATLTDADFTGAIVRGTTFDIYRGATFGVPIEKGTGISLPQLYSTASYQSHDLTGIRLGTHDLSAANFVDQNLTDASFYGATLTDAAFTGAEVRRAHFDKFFDSCYYSCFASELGTGVTLAQLYSTASYQAKDLSGIGLSGNNLAGGNFAGQNLTNASFSGATLTGAVLTAADARGAYLYQSDINLIRPDGHIDSLDLNAGGLLVVRDYDGNPSDFYGNPVPPIPVTVDQHLAMGPDGTLRMVFDADEWDSTISFAPGIPVTLGGTLELTFAADVNLASQIGRTLDLFDWTGVTPTGAFTISSPYAWDLSNLYATGEVTLTAIPEPTSFALAAAGALSLTFYRGRKTP